MFNFISKIVDFLDFCCIWHLGGFGRMENTPTGHADDLPTILGIFKNDPKSRSVNIFFSGWILPPNSTGKLLKQVVAGGF